MIDSDQLRRLATGSEDRILIDHRGEPIEVEDLADDASVPALLVAPMTEAVKQIEDELVAHHVDRDRLWAVEGFILDGAVVAALPDEVGTPAGLIAAVAAAGFQWQVVRSP